MKRRTATTGSILLDGFAKKAFLEHMSPNDVLTALSYGAFLGGKLVDPSKHPDLHTAADAAGLLGLGLSTGYDMLKSPKEYKPGAKDLLGLALMGSALYDRAKAH